MSVFRYQHSSNEIHYILITSFEAQHLTNMFLKSRDRNKIELHINYFVFFQKKLENTFSRLTLNEH